MERDSPMARRSTQMRVMLRTVSPATIMRSHKATGIETNPKTPTIITTMATIKTLIVTMVSSYKRSKVRDQPSKPKLTTTLSNKKLPRRPSSSNQAFLLQRRRRRPSQSSLSRRLTSQLSN
jgi:hypothetical protein